VSVNMMDGPGPSSVATRVIGKGLLENLGIDACLESVGRSEPAEGGLPLDGASFFAGILSMSISDAGLLPVPSETDFKEAARFEIDDGRF
jgi:hypothetical protein